MTERAKEWIEILLFTAIATAIVLWGAGAAIGGL